MRTFIKNALFVFISRFHLARLLLPHFLASKLPSGVKTDEITNSMFFPLIDGERHSWVDAKGPRKQRNEQTSPFVDLDRETVR